MYVYLLSEINWLIDWLITNLFWVFRQDNKTIFVHQVAVDFLQRSTLDDKLKHSFPYYLIHLL